MVIKRQALVDFLIDHPYPWHLGAKWWLT